MIEQARGKISLFIVSCFTLSLLLISCSSEEATSQTINQEQQNNETITMKLTSIAFKHSETIPKKYTCDGDNTNPELQISHVPKGTVSLVLIMDDPDIPTAVKEARGIQVFDHWVIFNIPPETRTITTSPSFGTLGKNSAGQNKYTGPCPPPQYQPTTHRYFFKLHALDTTLDLPAGATKAQVELAMHGHIIEQAELMGKYDRS